MKTLADIADRLSFKAESVKSARFRRTACRVWMEEFGKFCLDCDRRMYRILDHPHRATIDHITAKCFGGTDDLENLQVICLKCNAEKGRIENSRAQLARAKLADDPNQTMRIE